MNETDAPLRVFWCTNHDGVFLSGSSIVVAHDAEEATRLLDAALIAKNLKPFDQHGYLLVEMVMTKPHAVVMWDGDY